MAIPTKNNNINALAKDLGYLGVEFQNQLLKVLIEDRQFFTKIESILNQNMFSNEYVRRIVGLMKDRFAKTNEPLTYIDLELLCKTKVRDEIALENMLELIKSVQSISSISIDIIESEAERFFKQQNLIKAVNKANDIIKRGNSEEYEKIEGIFSEALQVNIGQDLGQHPFDNFEKDLADDYRETIPTGTVGLDAALGGGLGRGELGVIVAPMGVGKTSITSGFVAAAATTKTPQNGNQGYKVLHIYFEDKPQSIMRKYYGHVTNIDADQLSKRKEEIIELCNTTYAEQKEMMNRNVYSVRMASGEITATAIRNLIKRYISLGFRPDMVVIDYFECLKLERGSGDNNSSEWSMEGVTMRKLESLANELDIAIWIPIQGTKDSIGAEYVGLGQAGGSVKKTQIGHVVVTLAQTPDQKEQGRLNMFICKLRAVRMTRCKFQNVAFNNGTCRFDESTFNEEDDLDFGSEETQSVAAQAVAEIMAANKSKRKK